jgi:hypothetical protein
MHLGAISCVFVRFVVAICFAWEICTPCSGHFFPVILLCEYLEPGSAMIVMIVLS